jgi:hypothetical protein
MRKLIIHQKSSASLPENAEHVSLLETHGIDAKKTQKHQKPKTFFLLAIAFLVATNNKNPPFQMSRKYLEGTN